MRKILVIILFAVAGALAKPLGTGAFSLLTAGYSSLGRIEASAFDIRLGPGEVDKIYGGANLLRFDIRTGYDEAEYESSPISLGAPIITVPLAAIEAITAKVSEGHSLSIPGLLAYAALFLASGKLGYSFLNFDYFRLSVFESHVFEWWLYKKQGKWHMDEAGWGLELGLEMEFPHIMLDGGAQFEITNKQKGIGWFARVKLFDMFDIFR